MKKPFLLTASEPYYPESGTGDWVGCFETREEAEKQIPDGHDQRLGPIYHIIDLRDWVE